MPANVARRSLLVALLLVAVAFAGCSSGGGGGNETIEPLVEEEEEEAPIDTVPPAVANVQLVETTPDSATLRWTVADNTVDVISYILLQDTAGTQTQTDEVDGTGTHELTIDELAAGATYSFRIFAVDGGGNIGSTPLGTFSTAPPPPDALAVTNATAVLTHYDTSADAFNVTVAWIVAGGGGTIRSVLSWGADAALGNVSADQLGSGGQQVSIIGLAPETTLYYQINATSSDDAAGVGNLTLEIPESPDLIPPVLGSVTKTNITSSSVTITWAVTDERGVAESVVHYWPTGEEDDPITSATQVGVGPQEVVLTGLSSGTLHYFFVTAIDGGNNTVSSAEQTFSTSGSGGGGGDLAGPGISTIEHGPVTTSSATINWTVVDASGVASTYIEYGEGGFTDQAPLSPFSGNGTHSVNLAGLSQGVTYDYRVVAEDTLGNTATSTTYQFTTGTVPLSVLGFTITAVDLDTIEVEFDLAGPPDAQAKVEYGTTPAYGSEVMASAGPGNKPVTISGLAQDTLYLFSVNATAASTGEALDAPQSGQKTAELVLVTVDGSISSAVPGATCDGATPGTVSVQGGQYTVFSITNSWDAGISWQVAGIGASITSVAVGATVSSASVLVPMGLHDQLCDGADVGDVNAT